MRSRGVIPSVLIAGLLVAVPTFAGQEQQHRRGKDGQRAQGSEQSAPRERAVPRDQGQRQQPRDQAQREQPRDQGARQNQGQRYDVPQPRQNAQPPQRQYEQPRQNDRGRQYERPRATEQPRGDVNRGYNNDRAVPRVYERHDYAPSRPYAYYGAPRYGNGYYGHGYIAPRVIRPTIVTVVPYRPYSYRPSWSIGVYYGYNNYYPYGYTPRAYYDPMPGVAYGGLRLTDLPRDAQVFADGYFVGLVDDFDGIFQHLNLEAGGHHIEIVLPGGYQPPLAFDVFVRPGETITYRAGY